MKKNCELLPKNCVECEHSLWGAFLGVRCMLAENRTSSGDIPDWCPLEDYEEEKE